MTEKLTNAAKQNGEKTLFAQRAFLNGSQLPDAAWGLYNSPISEYNQSFFLLLDGGSVDRLIPKKQSPVIVDLMAPTGTLRNIFSNLPKDKTPLGIALGLQDLRTKDEKEKDDNLNIKAVTGNINNSKTWKELEEAMEGRKADLIIERGVSGLNNVVNHPLFYATCLQRMWKMLEEEGTILAEVPFKSHALGIRLADITSILRKNGIQARNRKTTIMIRKPINAPKDLPLDQIKLEKTTEWHVVNPRRLSSLKTLPEFTELNNTAIRFHQAEEG